MVNALRGIVDGVGCIGDRSNRFLCSRNPVCHDVSILTQILHVMAGFFCGISHFLHGTVLLGHDSRHFLRKALRFANCCDNLMDGCHRYGCRGLNGADLRGDFIGGLRRARGKVFHLCGDNSKPPAAFAGPGSLNRGIECQKIGLLGNGLYQGNDFTDALGGT